MLFSYWIQTSQTTVILSSPFEVSAYYQERLFYWHEYFTALQTDQGTAERSNANIFLTKCILCKVMSNESNANGIKEARDSNPFWFETSFSFIFSSFIATMKKFLFSKYEPCKETSCFLTMTHHQPLFVYFRFLQTIDRLKL